MNDDEKLNCMFNILSGIRWTSAERYRNGVLALLKDCSDMEQLAVIEHVLKTLVYCNSADLYDGAVLASKELLQTWSLQPRNTLIVGLAEPNKTCGSTAYIRALEGCLPKNWESCINTNFNSAFRHRVDQENLVLVDDFIGSGEKIDVRITKLLNNPKTKSYKIYVVAFSAMQNGVDVIASRIDGRIHVKQIQTKCISSILPPEKAISFAKSMAELEEKIFSRPGKYSFGYKQSEASFYLEAFNIPNNTFPILWWEQYVDKTQRATLFTRR